MSPERSTISTPPLNWSERRQKRSYVARYFLIRHPHRGSYQVPEWIFDQEAGAFAIVAVQRLPVGQLN